MKHKTTGVLLINLGTPSQATRKAVRHYLNEFLSDPRVIDLPFLIRQLLLKLVILPFRSKQSAKAYQSIWTEQGSPLLVLNKAMRQRLQDELGTDYQVTLAMRYGTPSIKAGLAQLANCERLVILPLYPQYASSSSGSSIEAVLKELKQGWNIPSFSVIREFYQHAGYIKAQAERIAAHFTPQKNHFLLLSYHGLPERHVVKSGCQTLCQQACPSITATNTSCYRAQCFETSRLLAKQLNLSANDYATTFQSRLGRTPWIGPYTDEVLKPLRDKGITALSVACPAFVTDCLETLEEIGMALKEQWLSLGGENFKLIPCINDDASWIRALSQIIHQTLPTA